METYSQKHTPPLVRPIKSPQNKAIDQLQMLKYRVYYPKNLKTIVDSPPSDDEGKYQRYIKNSAKIFQTQNIISGTSYSLHHKTALQNSFFASRMKNKSASLSSFKLEIWNKIDHPESKTLFKSLASMKNLQDFEVSLDFCDFLATHHLHFLFDHLLCAKKLTRFTFLASSCQGFELNALCSLLARSPQLQTLALSFDSSVDDCDQFINTLTPALSKLTSLTQIHLFPTGSGPIQAETLKKFFMTLSTIKSLTDISLFVDFCDENPLAECLQYLNASSIRKLRLNTYRNLANKDLIQISQALEKFTSLHLFYLDLSRSPGISDMGLTQLCSALGRLKSLTSLSLLFPKFTQNIAPALKSFQNLVYLKLSFKTAEPSYDQVQELSSSLKMLKFSLKFIEVSLPGSFSDSMIESLAEALKELTLLRHLSLDFRFTHDITARGVEALGSAMQRLTNLSSLCLSFVNSKEIDKAAIVALSQALQSLPSLYSIELDLAQCDKINSEGNGLQSLFAVFHEMKNVWKLNLRLPLCSDLIQEVDKLKKRFNLQADEFLDSLEILTL